MSTFFIITNKSIIIIIIKLKYITNVYINIIKVSIKNNYENKYFYNFIIGNFLWLIVNYLV